jgi:hypothetical protein
MNNFDSKWQACAALARQKPPGDMHAPAGFAGRVLARASIPEAPGLAEVWQALVTRLLAGSVAMLLLCTALEWPHLWERPTLQTGVENTVAQLLWSL